MLYLNTKGVAQFIDSFDSIDRSLSYIRITSKLYHARIKCF